MRRTNCRKLVGFFKVTQSATAQRASERRAAPATPIRRETKPARPAPARRGGAALAVAAKPVADEEDWQEF